MNDSADTLALVGSIIVFVIILQLLLQIFVPEMDTQLAKSMVAVSVTVIAASNGLISYYIILWSTK